MSGPVVERTAEIEAPPATVWAYLSDLPRWAEWDPDIDAVTAIRGTLDGGGEIDIRLRGRPGTIRFAEVETERRVRWTGRLLGGLVRTDATFTLAPLDGARTRFTYAFRMTGPVGGLAHRMNRKMVIEGTERGLANIAEGAERSG